MKTTTISIIDKPISTERDVVYDTKGRLAREDYVVSGERLAKIIRHARSLDISEGKKPSVFWSHFAPETKHEKHHREFMEKYGDEWEKLAQEFV